MPTWWGKKSSKSKEQVPEDEPRAAGVLHFNFIKSPIRKQLKGERPKSFDDAAAAAARISPRASRDLSSSAAACCNSDVGEKRGVPLPRPSVSSTQSFGTDQAIVFGSASLSGSSVSSSGSCDDQPPCHSQSPVNPSRFVMLFDSTSIHSVLGSGFFGLIDRCSF